MASQPNSLSLCAVSRSSTPSATLVTPNASASSIADRAIVAARWSSRIGAMSWWSSLTSSMGSSRRYVRVERDQVDSADPAENDGVIGKLVSMVAVDADYPGRADDRESRGH